MAGFYLLYLPRSPLVASYGIIESLCMVAAASMIFSGEVHVGGSCCIRAKISGVFHSERVFDDETALEDEEGKTVRACHSMLSRCCSPSQTSKFTKQRHMFQPPQCTTEPGGLKLTLSVSDGGISI
jgi:hypothetical protein